MIVGVGVEWVDVRRFAAATRRGDGRLQARLFTPAELAYAAQQPRSLESLAVRFAAKVAARRALGGRSGRWRDLEVVREPVGAPSLVFHGDALDTARRLGVDAVSVSLSHDARWGFGQVILESSP